VVSPSLIHQCSTNRLVTSFFRDYKHLRQIYLWQTFFFLPAAAPKGRIQEEALKTANYYLVRNQNLKDCKNGILVQQ
jgi:hypothetical protein